MYIYYLKIREKTESIKNYDKVGYEITVDSTKDRLILVHAYYQPGIDYQLDCLINQLLKSNCGYFMICYKLVVLDVISFRLNFSLLLSISLYFSLSILHVSFPFFLTNLLPCNVKCSVGKSN